MEHGPTTIQAANPVLDALIRDAGLDLDRLAASKAVRKRYIVREGKPVAAPSSPADLVTGSLFSGRARRRALREPLIPKSRPSAEESVADFTRRRFGPEALDYGMEPLVAGVYGGDPTRLAMRHAFPGLWRMEQEAGSIVRGLIRRKKKSRKPGNRRHVFLPKRPWTTSGGAFRRPRRPRAPVHARATPGTTREPLDRFRRSSSAGNQRNRLARILRCGAVRRPAACTGFHCAAGRAFPRTVDPCRVCPAWRCRTGIPKRAGRSSARTDSACWFRAWSAG